MEFKAVKAVKLGEYVQLKENGPMFKRGAYDKASKQFELTKCSDISSSIYRKGTTQVIVGATY